MNINEMYPLMFSEYPDVVSVADAAAMLHRERHSIGRLIRSGKLKACKAGRSYLIPKCCLIEFLLQNNSAMN